MNPSHPRPRLSMLSNGLTRALAASAGALLLTAHGGWAASATWSATPTNGFWEAAGAENNWGTGAGTFPGATSGSTSTDVATFLASSGTTISINASTSNVLELNIASITFGVSGGTPSSFTIGSTSGNALLLSNSGTIMLSSGITGTVTETVNAPLRLAGTAYTIRNDSSNAANTLQIGGSVAGTSGAATLTLRGGNTGTNSVTGLIGNGGATSVAVTKADSALWVLGNRANSYTGATTVNGGTLRAVDTSIYASGNQTMTGGGAMGTGQVVVNGGALQLRVNGDDTAAAQILTYANSSFFANTTTTSTVDVARAGGSTAQNKTLSFASSSVARGGKLTVTGSNGYALRLNNLNMSGSGDGSYTLNPTTGMMIISGTFNNNTASTTATAILDGSSTGNQVTANIIDAISGGARVMAITKSGASTWTLTGANTYSGVTTVSAGTLLVNGTHTGGGAYSLTGGTLGGSGSITAASLTASTGAKLSAGGDGTISSTLTFALAGGMDLSAASNDSGAYVFDLGAVGASDKITLTTGTLNVGTLDFADFTFTATTGFGDGTYVLFDAASAITGTIGTATGMIGGKSATVSIDNLNNDVLLTVVPEPSTSLLIGSAALGLVALARRRRRIA